MKTLALSLAAALFLLLAPASGCGSSKVTRTTTNTTVERADGTVDTKTTVQKDEEEDDDGGPTGILSSTINGIGYIISFPFKAIAFLIDVIF